MVIELAEDEHVCMGERPLGVCYATQFTMRGVVIGIALAVPRGDGDVSVQFHTTPAGASLRPLLESLVRMVAASGRQELRRYQDEG